ncbi:MAG TPA: SPOR domain-containing protein [Cyclobacteriaceae bacterium]|nr:SPOR domain-containing protein [Cyclobacteriaceae bacterium]
MTIYDLRPDSYREMALSQLNPFLTVSGVIRNSSFVILTIMAFSCAAQKKDSKTYYHEDLYSLRPKFQEPIDTAKKTNTMIKMDVTATHNVNALVDPILDSINRFNLTRKLIDGYTIQIYSGQNREEAMNAKKKMVTDITDMNAELEYNQPKFRVRVGGYFSRLEAQKDLIRLKQVFPNAILVPEKIMVR